MGEMLAATERAKPRNPKPPKERRLHDVTDDAPTLKELGISKRESAETQNRVFVQRAFKPAEFWRYAGRWRVFRVLALP